MKKIFEQKVNKQIVCVYRNLHNDIFIGNIKDKHTSCIVFDTQESIRIAEIINRIKNKK